MKRLPVAIVLLIVMLSTIASTVGCGIIASTKHLRDITVSNARSQIQDNVSNPNFVIIDVRTPSEYNEGHIQNAINLDYTAPTFRDDIGKMGKNNTYLVYCQSGNRSKGAVEIMKELNFKDIYHMYEGLTGWIDGGYPTVK